MLALLVGGVAPIAWATGAAAPDAASAARQYRASLANLLPFHEQAVTRARDTLVKRRQLFEDGLIARRDAEAAEAALAAAESALAATHTEIAEADRMVVEADAAEVLASLPPPRTGAVTETPTLLRFHGPRAWSLAQVAELERFFTERFHRALPVSARGQTPAHDRLGFDHRNALDVAVHPDTAEGQALMAWLRTRGVPFLAFRGAVAGEATGAHVHVGEPSPRRTLHLGEPTPRRAPRGG